jgi:hypothetical protein
VGSRDGLGKPAKRIIPFLPGTDAGFKVTYVQYSILFDLIVLSSLAKNSNKKILEE